MKSNKTRRNFLKTFLAAITSGALVVAIKDIVNAEPRCRYGYYNPYCNNHQYWLYQCYECPCGPTRYCPTECTWVIAGTCP